jgi:hypothetical protein
MEEELVGQRRDIGGGRVGTCDLCGKPDQNLTLTSRDGTGQLGETDLPVHVCGDCLRRLAEGEFPVEPDEFEPPY